MNSNNIKKEIFQLVKAYYAEKFGPKGKFIPGKDKVNYAGRVFDENELTNLVDAALDFWLTEGRFADEFEAKLSKYFSVSDAVLVNSGSSANLVAMSVLMSPELGDRRLRPGDEVITVAAGFPSTVAPIIQDGLVPVFVDVQIGTYNAIPEKIEEALAA